MLQPNIELELSNIRPLEPDIRSAFLNRRTPLVLQAETADCGIACLAMIAGYFGSHVSAGELRRRNGSSLKGTTLSALIGMADSLGLAARPVRLELDEIRQLRLPAIAHWDLSHFVVITKVDSRNVWLNDPAIGSRKLALKEVSDHFTGVALEFALTPVFKRETAQERVRLSELFAGSRGLSTSIVFLIGLAGLLQAASILTPVLTQSIVDNVLGRGDLQLLNAIVIGLLLLAFASALVSYLRGLIALYMRTQLGFGLQTNLYRHILRLPVSWFEKRQIGDIVSRFASLSPVQALLTDSLPTSILDLSSLFFSGVMMGLYSPVLMLVTSGLMSLVLAVRLFSNRYYRRLSLEGLSKSSGVQSIFLETMRGARTIKAFGKESDRLVRWQNEQVIALNNAVRLQRFSLWTDTFATVITGVQMAVTLYIGATLVIQGSLSLGMLFAYQAFAAQFSGAATRMIGQLFNYQTAGVHLERLADIVYSDPETPQMSPVVARDDFRGAISVEGLSFRYAERDPLTLRDISLKIPPGQFICITGPSGHGKTSLLKLLLGFYPPTSGAIMIDGDSLETIGLPAYRSLIGVVLQDDQLFAGSIIDNITFFETDPDVAGVERAARLASVHDDIEKLPMQYQSLVGDMGSSLSGGQKQRLFIARALYREPRILFMDEGTASLDLESERRIVQTLKSLSITRVVVAHREAMLLGADRVIAIENGFISSDTSSAESDRRFAMEVKLGL